MLIVFDGIDGGGKSTQIELACKWLQSEGESVKRLADPGSTVLGKELRRLLLETNALDISPLSEMLMFMAARAQLVSEEIRPALNRGEIVVCDRFGFSTVVYQGHGTGLDTDQIWTVNQIATGGLVPDLTILLDLPAELAFARLRRSLDRMESRGLDYFERVRSGFLREANRWPTNVVVLDANRPTDAIERDVRTLIAAVVAGKKS
jgi:dTMP kinase